MPTVVITGANRGIGLALCQDYVKNGWHVLALCRKSSAELAATGAQIFSGIDLKNVHSLTQLVQELKHQPIDILINNAGILRPEHLGNLDTASITEQFLVNALAPIKVAEAFLPLLNPGAKVAFITSRMGSIADNTSGGYYGYRMSKAALNAGAKSFCEDVKSRQIAVAILHPGYVQTAMVNFGGDISAEVAAGRLALRISQLNMDNTGLFWHSNGEVLPW
ncbi:MAG: hypothetical protein RL497_992 [Pseudomonadota bacterium]|jgi:NAD(P)-dependent dehydrogenase (short-subunit alcohol dehydrogenase family)